MYHDVPTNSWSKDAKGMSVKAFGQIHSSSHETRNFSRNRHHERKARGGTLTSCLSPGAAKHTHTSHKNTYLQCFTIIYRIYTIIYIRNSCCLISSQQATRPHFGSFQHLQPEAHFLHDQINLFLPPLRYIVSIQLRTCSCN